MYAIRSYYDLKPNNVFLTPHGVKLLDFGLARPVKAELMLTREVREIARRHNAKAIIASYNFV